jgi:hypothetical protein
MVQARGDLLVRKYIENKERADFDVICDSFVEDEVFTGLVMPIITIYNNTTKDYPGKFVARLYDIKPGEVCRTRYILLSDRLDKLRKKIPFGMTRFSPQAEDDPVVLETWI